MIDNITLAGILYTEYCVKVGGKAFNGDTLPTWEEFYNDPKKVVQAKAWIAVADKALGIFTDA